MQNSPRYFLLSYLHRDVGNYKTFGTITVLNDLQLPLDDIDRRLRRHLIDECFFYASKWGFPSLDPEPAVEGFESWHEYLAIETATTVPAHRLRMSALLTRLGVHKDT